MTKFRCYSPWDNGPGIGAMVGKTMVSVTGGVGSGEMIFTADDGSVFRFYHSQDCCESVDIEDVCGDLNDLVGSPITQAEDVSSVTPDPVVDRAYPAESETWTFYKFATVKGSVTVRWYGSSNGYHSEDVDLEVTLPVAA